MGEFSNLVMPFFSTPSNYAEMLKKLAGAVFYEVYFFTFLLRDIPQIGNAFRTAESYGSLGAAVSAIPIWSKANPSGFVIAVLIAVVAHLFQLHDRVSDVLGIRRRFDTNRILLPLAQRVGATLTAAQIAKIPEKRHELMHRVFYRYASSRADKPLVDRHDIEHALAAWSWFWMLVEASVLSATASIVFYFFGNAHSGAIVLSIAVFLLCISFLQSLRLPRYSRPQIEAIARNADASADIRAAFDAL